MTPRGGVEPIAAAMPMARGLGLAETSFAPRSLPGGWLIMLRPISRARRPNSPLPRHCSMLRDDLRGPESNRFRAALVKTVKRHYARVNPKPNAISALLQEHTLGPRAHSNPISQPSHPSDLVGGRSSWFRRDLARGPGPCRAALFRYE